MHDYPEKRGKYNRSLNVFLYLLLILSFITSFVAWLLKELDIDTFSNKCLCDFVTSYDILILYGISLIMIFLGGIVIIKEYFNDDHKRIRLQYRAYLSSDIKKKNKWVSLFDQHFLFYKEMVLKIFVLLLAVFTLLISALSPGHNDFDYPGFNPCDTLDKLELFIDVSDSSSIQPKVLIFKVDSQFLAEVKNKNLEISIDTLSSEIEQLNYVIAEMQHNTQHEIKHGLFLLVTRIDSLTKAINNFSGYDSPKNSEDSNSAVVIILTIAFVLFFILLIISLINNWKFIAVAATAYLLGTISITLGLISIDKLELNFDFSKIQSEKPANSKQKLEYFRFEIFPFKTGSTIMEESAKEKLATLIEKLQEPEVEIDRIDISGGFDKRELGDSLKLIYGSNVGLAEARVNAIKSYIIKNIYMDSNYINTFIKGPEMYHYPFHEKNLEKDRSVEVNVHMFRVQRHIALEN